MPPAHDRAVTRTCCTPICCWTDLLVLAVSTTGPTPAGIAGPAGVEPGRTGQKSNLGAPSLARCETFSQEQHADDGLAEQVQRLAASRVRRPGCAGQRLACRGRARCLASDVSV